MTDRMLTEEEIATFEGWAKRHTDNWQQAHQVCASHRLQAARIQELEKSLKKSEQNLEFVGAIFGKPAL